MGASVLRDIKLPNIMFIYVKDCYHVITLALGLVVPGTEIGQLGCGADPASLKAASGA